MKTFINIGFTASLINLTLASVTNHSRMNAAKPKRALLTCLETYGGGSVDCGGQDSLFCYDPTLGETCCEMDNGYCVAGDFCAPVAGYCCTNGEDPETCAARLNFTLPSSFSLAPATALHAFTFSNTSALIASPTRARLTTTSTSTIRISLALVIPTEAATQVAALTVDTDGMTPQFTAPVGNNVTPDDISPADATRPASATRTGDSGFVAFTGAAAANRITEMGSSSGLVVALLGLTLWF
ncbi:hypothetical protein ONS95_007852 [Cadophora gregata]|uniref:uncharacterized protein n=1 Tax=Cadophora gregata TaxID=51156 RepID=UPI0026DB5100|nr:uncharacterized protein ONS95_007852 [Cadophora gregata]KAK0118985.1 hypothetical protein ONS96_012058 [Cadophora gregata f. sp. sojae]KAK0126239.1 hypothetical protein ONS95_007852 [Cadophora gregata]